MQRVSGELALGEVRPVLLEPQAAEIVMDFDKILIERESLSVGIGGIVGLAGAVLSETEIIPCERICTQKRGGGLELVNGLGVFAAVDKIFSFPQRFRAGRFAAGENKGEGERNEKTKSAATAGKTAVHQPFSIFRVAVFDGQHQSSW